LPAAAEDRNLLPFVAAMGRVPASVFLVTCEIDGKPWAVTISAFASISVEPPTLAISLGTRTAAAGAIAATGRFGVSLLSAGQTGLARFGSAPGQPKFLDAKLQGDFAELNGCLVVRHSVCGIACQVRSQERVADHTVFFGAATGIEVGRPVPPLLYRERRYRNLGGDIDHRRAPEPDPLFDTLVHAV
jgi:flavin reductase (DIM6/NTAB) family NADH-FMN oxidoreductase RutF